MAYKLGSLLADNVAIEPINQNDLENDRLKSKYTSIIIPVSKKDQGAPTQGYVRAISPDIKDPQCKLGDRVVFINELPQGYHFEDYDCFIVPIEKVIAVIK